MMVHLDTNFLIRSLLYNAPEAASLDRWVGSEEGVGISTVAWCEFLCGPISAEMAAQARATLGHPIPFLPEDGVAAANLFNATGRRRGSLLDCMIAAVALRAGAMIATNNRGDFKRFESMGLRLAES